MTLAHLSIAKHSISQNKKKIKNKNPIKQVVNLIKVTTFDIKKVC